MRFVISRTTQITDDEPPCAGATRGTWIATDERIVADPTLVPASKGEAAWWYDHGRNHRVVNGHIMRDVEAEGWMIEIADLAALLAFIDAQEHEAVIGRVRSLEPLYTLEIYDGYRE